MISFCIRSDTRNKYYKGRQYNKKVFRTVNEAVEYLKRCQTPNQICLMERPDDCIKFAYMTIMLFEGRGRIGCFTEQKKKTLTEIGEGIYVPTRLARKTTFKRKRNVIS